MIPFYKRNIEYLTAHSVDPDRRRYSDPKEAVRHYIDLEHYSNEPFDSIPRFWKDAVAKYSEDTLQEHGIVPWHISLMILRLTDAFREMNPDKILYQSANLGHYIADAHVPLHTTENYNGQKTNQRGIHGFWETRLPELFSENWNFLVGRAKYIQKTDKEIWKIILDSNAAKDSVLTLEAKLNSEWPTDTKYIIKKNKKVYSPEYSAAYDKLLNGMVERRMRESILSVGNFWYTAWVNAGQPNLSSLIERQVSDSLKNAVIEPEQKENKKDNLKGHED